VDVTSSEPAKGPPAILRGAEAATFLEPNRRLVLVPIPAPPQWPLSSKAAAKADMLDRPGVSDVELTDARATVLSPSSVGPCVLWRVAVHGLQLAMGEGESRRHIHLAAYDFDIGAGFAGAGRLHRFIEFAERGHTSGKPVGATKRLG
jgi:hypothetical protein